MHHALYLPEIVATILKMNSSAPGFLHTCLFISKTFSLEACRLLWYECGAYSNSSPEIKHLAQIFIQDAPRAQYYANLIHTLSFMGIVEESDEGAVLIDESRWHKELLNLQFPKLEDFTIHESCCAPELNTGDVIIHYAQPNIECFRINLGSSLSDTFFDTLTYSCPRLRNLELSGISAGGVSKDGLVRFLNKANALEWLIIRTGVYDSWSYEVFEAIARLPNLSHIEIPDIKDTWVQSICDTNPSTLIFPSLKELETGISDHDLECLARHVPNLDELSICLQHMPPSHNILASASNFPHLTSLEVEFGPQNSISGNELLLLARNCSSLNRLYLGRVNESASDNPNPSCTPTSLGINDDTIDGVAQMLGAALEDFNIVLDQPDLLTWQSITSLAQYCKNLVGLTISCNFNWQETMTSRLEHIFPELDRLDLIFDRDVRELQVEEDYPEEMIESCAQRMFHFAPKLAIFWIEGGNEGDIYWEAAVMKIFHDNYRSQMVDIE
ncbi:hypothetical protein NHQ30_006248 [Ciborinia camelliae]|nr:hypothetical protein NHQ30_006248 [Ciborinia camelliae]